VATGQAALDALVALLDLDDRELTPEERRAIAALVERAKERGE
jgi:hypothetical protein